MGGSTTSIMLKSTDFLRRTIVPAGGQGGVTVSDFAHIAIALLQNLWRKYEWRALNRLLVVQTGVSASQAKVFKAHAERQGLCENLINALKLLANHQKDGDSPIQSIVTGLCERSRTGIMEGLRNFIKVENHSALDVGHLEEGIRPFEVRRPKFKEGGPEASIREGPKELTLRAEEVGSQKSCFNVDHIAEDKWDRPWLTLTGIPFAKQSTKELKAANGRNCTSNTKK